MSENKDVKCFDASREDLPKVADVFIQCFPNSFSSKLGKKYVAKSLEWFVETPDTTLTIFHKTNNEIVGFLGTKKGFGSTSEMIQYAFREAIKGLLLKPWLCFSPIISKNYKLIFRNVIKKIQPKKIEPSIVAVSNNTVITTGLVVIGVSPNHQGKGYGSLILKEFDKLILDVESKSGQGHLSVKKNNHLALHMYEKNGWIISSSDDNTYHLEKKLSRNKI